MAGLGTEHIFKNTDICTPSYVIGQGQEGSILGVSEESQNSSIGHVWIAGRIHRYPSHLIVFLGVSVPML